MPLLAPIITPPDVAAVTAAHAAALADLAAILGERARLTLSDAFVVARSRGLSDGEALVALERLARPSVAALTRFYVDRSGAVPRLLASDEVRATLAALYRKREKRAEWASRVEVVWARSSADALSTEGSA